MGNSKLKPDGWWSRRHRTREAQDAAREAYQRGLRAALEHLLDDYDSGFGNALELENDPESVHRARAVLDPGERQHG